MIANFSLTLHDNASYIIIIHHTSDTYLIRFLTIVWLPGKNIFNPKDIEALSQLINADLMTLTSQNTLVVQSLWISKSIANKVISKYRVRVTNSRFSEERGIWSLRLACRRDWRSIRGSRACSTVSDSRARNMSSPIVAAPTSAVHTCRKRLLVQYREHLR